MTRASRLPVRVPPNRRCSLAAALVCALNSGAAHAHIEMDLPPPRFNDGANNVVLVGGSGTGKSHIATALGVQAVEHHHKKVRLFATVWSMRSNRQRP